MNPIVTIMIAIVLGFLALKLVVGVVKFVIVAAIVAAAVFFLVRTMR